MNKLRWGILGTGRIAHTFARDLAHLPGSRLAAVGSRSATSAQAMARTFEGCRAHASYAALAADPEVDVVYVATPHTLHRDNSLLCLEQGKAVLCEKPLAINAAQGQEMVAAARESGRFLMEAMWTRCNPVLREVSGRIASGAIGEPRMLQVDFGFRTDFDAKGRLFAPELGGGSLLDVGVYCLSLAHHVFGGAPEELVGLADIGRSGVDEQAAWVGRWSGGRLALMSSATRSNTPQEAVITGSEGRIRIPDFWRANSYLLGKEEHRFEQVGEGYHHEAAEVERCLAAGEQQSSLLPLAESIEVLRSMDRLRQSFGLRYPGE